MATSSSWSTDVPEELLEDIVRRLNTGIDDVIRFRSVCIPWRRIGISQSFYNPSPLSSIKVPPVCENSLNSFFAESGSHNSFFAESGSKVYRLELSQNISSSSSPVKGWLVRVDDKSPDKFHMLIPHAQSLPKVFNLSEFRISEICPVYTLMRYTRRVRNLTQIVSKIAFRPSNPGADNYVALGINFSKNSLAFFNSGEDMNEFSEILTVNGGDYYSDVINYKGKFYVVDFAGETIVIDAFSKLVTDRIASPMCDGGGNKKYLVECCGCLLLVDRFVLTHGVGIYFRPKITTFEVYMLNEQRHNWVEVESLGDQMVFVNNILSFSASARDFAGCKGNSIYFKEAFPPSVEIKHQYSGMFDMSNGLILALDCQSQTWIKRSKASCIPTPYDLLAGNYQRD